ncbi:MFS transporter [Brevibacillus fulvus]|uniref:FSR family fosmidomycin resistance protein-like MFS transporter n=1 Tax=Brevibacillus fulvus TaxID=1125967 RepID=A0A938Y235_9BACL|nr:MFS transporter [Brevibacillus fulvus]MBM7590984.1 FSR family fosmidomycin resistance protein-like MFS transporter [Brevibacillus fulvus]
MLSQSSTVYRILFAISLVHLLNDSLQAVIPAVLPILQTNLNLSYFNLGVILLVMNMTASVFQPVIGYFSDRKPRPVLLPLGMLSSGLGMLGIAFAPNYAVLLVAVAFVGLGSAVFHPEASKVAYLASGARRGLGQSIFQVGGNSGQALAPIMTTLIFIPLGQGGAAWFSLTALLALGVLLFIAYWYGKREKINKAMKSAAALYNHKNQRITALILLVLFVSVRSWIQASYQSFYPLYLIHDFGYSMSAAELYMFVYMLAGAVGTFFGGPIADRFGKRNLLIVSTLGALPFTLLIPYVTGFWAYPLLMINGLIMMSSFSVAVVYAQELMPGRVGMVSGLITGLSFGMGGIGASALGKMADSLGLSFVIIFCSIMPVIGLIGFFLPKDATLEEWEQEAA